MMIIGVNYQCLLKYPAIIIIKFLPRIIKKMESSNNTKGYLRNLAIDKCFDPDLVMSENKCSL